MSDTSVNVSRESNQQVMTVRIAGKFDYQLHREIRQSYRDINNIRTIVVDLSRTDYVDSSALGMLLLMRESVANKVENIILRNANEQIKNILKITRFDRLFTIQ